MPATPRQKRQRMARSIDKMMPANPKVKAGEVTVSARKLKQMQKLLNA